MGGQKISHCISICVHVLWFIYSLRITVALALSKPCLTGSNFYERYNRMSTLTTSVIMRLQCIIKWWRSLLFPVWFMCLTRMVR